MIIDVMDLHTHTIASGHAYNTIYEMARSASEKGLKLLGITDHGPAMMSAVPRNYFNNFKMLPRELYGVKVMFGCELNILDYEGNVDLEPFMLKKQDFAIASIHKACYTIGTPVQNTDAYVNTMKNPYIQIIGHPDDTEIPVDYEGLVLAAKENHVLLEMNSESLHPRCARKGTYANYLIMLEFCKKYDVPIVLDSDAHCEVDVGNHARSIGILENVGFPQELVINRSMRAAVEYIPFLKKLLDGDVSQIAASV